MRKPVRDLKPGDMYDAVLLVEQLIERVRADEIEEARDWAESVRSSAWCLWFEVEKVEAFRDGRVIIFGHPFNVPALLTDEVSIKEDWKPWSTK
jgi:hypothetical protein